MWRSNKLSIIAYSEELSVDAMKCPTPVEAGVEQDESVERSPRRKETTYVSSLRPSATE